MTATEVRSPLDVVRQLAPQIRSCADEIEAERELPKLLFEALADAGLFQLALPRTLGGRELDLPTYVQVIRGAGEGGREYGLDGQPGGHLRDLCGADAARCCALDLD
jgi:alkylation response protein AidB-like acyl-CoA dehydrogenase